MQLYKYPDGQAITEIIKRPLADASVFEKPVRKILQKVKTKGDKALRKLAKKFDGVILKDLLVTEKEINAAASKLTEELKQAILQAKKNIELFHQQEPEERKRIETMPGVVCWKKTVAIEKVGLYIPGGSAPLFSTVLMLGIPARMAGCKQVVLCTPPAKDGNIHPAILFAAKQCGISSIFKAGGAQAIAAMAYGTETIPAVSKIFGPGNPYVTIAKQIVQQDIVAIDMPAGPSEVLVIADQTAIPEFVAADLLSQAEHGPDSQVILLTTNETVAQDTIAAIERQLADLPRKKIATAALVNSRICIVDSLEKAIEIADRYAPEHLILSFENAEALAEKVSNAGSVFIGNYSPESAGDYASGTNHTLPTGGYAAMYSGVSVDSFVKKISYQQLTKEGLKNISSTVMEMAAAEGLDAHKNAIAIRLNK
jgi:histidinol dehydrogenase